MAATASLNLDQCRDLRTLPGSALAMLGRRAQLLTRGRGEMVWCYRDPVEEVFVLLKGSAHVQMSGPEGDLVLTGLVMPGRLIGEAEVFAGEPRRFNQVMAAEACQLAVLPRSAFWEAVEHYPEYSRYWLHLSNKKFIASLRQIHGLKVGCAKARLARILLLILRWQQGSEETEMALSQETVGQYAGLSRQVVNRILSEWKQAGLIRTGYGRITLKDRRALGRIAKDF